MACSSALAALPIRRNRKLKGHAGVDPGTPHYDGVKRDAKEPAVIALFGIAPVDLTLVDPGRPGWRQV
jgi:hypothetical protein